MKIIGKRSDGYFVECDGQGKSHSFVVENLGLTVICPLCGHCETSTDLATNYVFMQRSMESGRDVAVLNTQPLDPVDAANDFVYERFIVNSG